MPNDLSDENIDKTCMYCGEVMEGPHKGDTIPLDRPADPKTKYVMHKGSYVSHCGGHGCAAEQKHHKEFMAEYLKSSKKGKSSGDVPDVGE